MSWARSSSWLCKVAISLFASSSRDCMQASAMELHGFRTQPHEVGRTMHVRGDACMHGGRTRQARRRSVTRRREHGASSCQRGERLELRVLDLLLLQRDVQPPVRHHYNVSGQCRPRPDVQAQVRAMLQRLLIRSSFCADVGSLLACMCERGLAFVCARRSEVAREHAWLIMCAHECAGKDYSWMRSACSLQEPC